jgi:ethanolamine utilization protein EutA
MDIGGGTSNLSYIENGNITATGCLNVGGRLVKFDSAGKITYISPVLEGLTDLSVGEMPTQTQLRQLTDALTQALMMAAGLMPPAELLCKLTTKENTGLWTPKKAEVISFSGGVADCIESQNQPFAFGDLGVLLGQSIRKSDLCSGRYRLGEQTIRATVIGAGCHSARLSGSTVFYDGVELPQKNLPVVTLPMPLTAESVANAYAGQDTETVVLYLSGYPSPSYAQVQALAKTLVAGSGNRELLVCVEQDMAKALGHSIRLLSPGKPCLCIDRIKLQNESFLDIGEPVGPALPVVIKTLILSQ